MSNVGKYCFTYSDIKNISQRVAFPKAGLVQMLGQMSSRHKIRDQSSRITGKARRFPRHPNGSRSSGRITPI